MSRVVAGDCVESGGNSGGGTDGSSPGGGPGGGPDGLGLGRLSISAAQMKQSLMRADAGGHTSERELEEMLRALDLDNDGRVQMEDFVRLLVNEQNFPQTTTECDKCVLL